MIKTVLKSLEITLTEFCCKSTVSDVIKGDNPTHEYKLTLTLWFLWRALFSSCLGGSHLWKVIMEMLPCRWDMCLTLHVQSGTQLFIFLQLALCCRPQLMRCINPALNLKGFLTSSSGFPCKVVNWEGHWFQKWHDALA